MSRLEIVVDAVDVSDAVRDESIALEQVAFGGEIGAGGWDYVDDSLGDVPAWKDVTVEDARADTPRLLTGMTRERTIARGREKRATNRDWDVTVADVNALLEGIVLESSDATRPAETDYARITWLLTKLSGLGISAGVVPNTNTVNMDAVDYRREADGVRRVLSDCGEAAQKNYFLYDFGAGAKLYYDKHTGTSLSSTVQISTDPTDVDLSTVFPILQGASRAKDPTEIWSKVIFKYEGGYVTRTDSDAGVTTSTDFRQRETVVDDSTVKSSTKATAKADKYLVAASTETEKIQCSVEVTAEAAGEIQAGMRIQAKIPHLGISAFTYFRIIRRTLKLAETDGGTSRERYRLDLEFASDVKLTSFNDSRPPGDTDTGGTTDGSAASLTRYQLFEREAGPDYYSPAGMSWNSVPASFTFGSIASPLTDSKISRNGASYDITWPYGDCGIVAGVWAGRHTQEAWYRFDIDLDGDTTIVGVRITVAAPTASGDAVGAAIIVGAAIATPTARGQYVPVGSIPSSGGECFIPADLLQDDGDGHSWIVLAPSWDEPYGFMWCGSGTNPVFGTDTLGSGDVTATAVSVSGSGLSPWVPGVGDTDGSNATYSLPNWNGKGIPEVRVGNTILGAGEYTVDAGALTVTLLQPPPADMDGQVAFRFRMG